MKMGNGTMTIDQIFQFVLFLRYLREPVQWAAGGAVFTVKRDVLLKSCKLLVTVSTSLPKLISCLFVDTFVKCVKFVN